MSVRSETIRRLTSELRQLMREESDFRPFTVTPLPDNALEWHFTMLGPCNDDSKIFDTTLCENETPYQGGIYHGRIIFPSEYPFKPPDVMLLTPNGRFETQKKLCLSVTSYHPETWEPTFGVATVLSALRVFMLTCGNNAIGAMEVSFAVRQSLAVNSRTFDCSTCGASCAQEWEKLSARWAAERDRSNSQKERSSEETAEEQPPPVAVEDEAKNRDVAPVNPESQPAPQPVVPPQPVPPVEGQPLNDIAVLDNGLFTFHIRQSFLDFVSRVAMSVVTAVIVRRVFVVMSLAVAAHWGS